MSASATPFNATEYFDLLDVQLWETHLKRGIEYSPGLHDEKLGIQSRKGVEFRRFLVADPASGDAERTLEFLRVIVHLGLRGLHAVEDEDGDLGSVEDRLLFEIEASFAVIYQFKKEPEAKDLDKFVRLNCVHNAWPFWRQHVFDTLKRASLPVPPVPLFQSSDQDLAVVLESDDE